MAKRFKNRLGETTREKKVGNNTHRYNENYNDGDYNIYSAHKYGGQGKTDTYSSMIARNINGVTVSVAGVNRDHSIGNPFNEGGYTIRKGKTLKQVEAQLKRLEANPQARRFPMLMDNARTAAANFRNYNSLGARAKTASAAATAQGSNG